MRTIRPKKLLLTALLCLTLIPLSGCRALPALSRPVSGIAIAIDPAEPSQIAIDWNPATLPVDHAAVTVSTEGAITIIIHLLPPQQ